MKKIVLLFMMGFVTNSSFSQSLLSEDFAYTSTGTQANDTLTNPAVGGAVWKKHSGTGTPIVWTSSGLTYTGYFGSGIGGSAKYTNGSGSREDANIGLSDSIKTGSVYLSFMLNVTASGGTTGDYNIHFTSGAGPVSGSFGARIFIKDGSTSGTFKLGLSKGSAAAAAVFTASDYNYSQTYLVVLKYTFNIVTSTDDVVSAYILSTGVPATEPSVADLTATDMTVNDMFKIYGVAIRQGTVGTAAAMLDGIRVGTSWNYAPLPVKLASFSAIGLQKQVNLNWLTISEIGAANFIVERSFDGINFETAGVVVAKGNSSLNNNYQFTDNKVTASTIYYRLKIVSTDGRFEYSNIQKVTLRNIKLNVGPNPTANEILINASSAIDMVQVFDMNGKLKASKNGNRSNSLRIGVSAFANGSYIVKTTVEGVIETKTIVVNK